MCDIKSYSWFPLRSVLNTRHDQFEDGDYEPDDEFPFPHVKKRDSEPVLPPRFLPPAGLAETSGWNARNDSATTKRASFSTNAGGN